MAASAHQRRRRRFAALITSLVVASIAGSAPSLSIATTKPLPPKGTANIFVAANGSDTGANCRRFAPPRRFPANRATTCASIGKAYSIARPGDAVLVGSGSYDNQRICRGSVYPLCSPSADDKGPPTITIVAEARHKAVVRGVLFLGADNGANPPSYLTFDGIDVEGQVRDSFDPAHSKTTNITFKNGHVWSVKEWPIADHPLLENSQIDNMTIDHMEIGPGCCQGDLVGGGVANADVPTNFVVKSSVLHDLYDSCKYVPAAVNAKYGPCNAGSNIGFGDGAHADHVDGLQLWGARNLQLARNKWYAIGANGDPTGQTIFLESDPTGVCSYYDGILIENNAIYAGETQNNTVSMGLSGGAKACSPGLKNIRIVYNTIWAARPQWGNLSVGGIEPTTSVVIAGNIVKWFAATSDATCRASAKGGGLFQPTYRSNEFGNRTCGPGDHRGTAQFVRPDPLMPDLRLSGRQWALGHGELVYRPSTDIDGKLRPRRARPDVGASQREDASLSLSGRIGDVALGMNRKLVEQFYGGPHRVRILRDGSGGASTTTALYHVHGGTLSVGYRNSVAVSVATTSRYYSTPKGFGVGAPADAALKWSRCRGTRLRVARGVATTATIARNRVTSVAVARRQYVDC
jgi:hypothetical protein